MSNKCKWILGSVVLAIVFLMLFCIRIFIIRNGVFSVYFSLHGEETVYVSVNEMYVDAGATCISKFHDYSDEIEIVSNVDTSEIGEYTITYKSMQTTQTQSRRVVVQDTTKPQIKLLGNNPTILFLHDTYEEAGASAIDNYEFDVSEKIKIQENINTNELGSYEVTYSVQDESGNTSEKVRVVKVVEDPMNHKVDYNYDMFDNKNIAFYFDKSVDHEQNTSAFTSQYLEKFNAYYIGEDEKVIYLTFDEGGSEVTYVEEIAEVLNKYDIDATFFVTKNYILNNADMINDMVANNHLIANHTWNHLDMYTLANEQSIDDFVEELTSVEQAYLSVTGKEMEKIFRFPKGESSERGLKIVQDLGYETYFWSHAFMDFKEDLSKEDAYDAMIEYYHNGAIYLLHPNNKGNYLALEQFVQDMLKKGYTFKSLSDFK